MKYLITALNGDVEAKGKRDFEEFLSSELLMLLESIKCSNCKNSGKDWSNCKALSHLNERLDMAFLDYLEFGFYDESESFVQQQKRQVDAKTFGSTFYRLLSKLERENDKTIVIAWLKQQLKNEKTFFEAIEIGNKIINIPYSEKLLIFEKKGDFWLKTALFYYGHPFGRFWKLKPSSSDENVAYAKWAMHCLWDYELYDINESFHGVKYFEKEFDYQISNTALTPKEFIEGEINRIENEVMQSANRDKADIGYRSGYLEATEGIVPNWEDISFEQTDIGNLTRHIVGKQNAYNRRFLLHELARYNDNPLKYWDGIGKTKLESESDKIVWTGRSVLQLYVLMDMLHRGEYLGTTTEIPSAMEKHFVKPNGSPMKRNGTSSMKSRQTIVNDKQAIKLAEKLKNVIDEITEEYFIK